MADASATAPATIKVTAQDRLPAKAKASATVSGSVRPGRLVLAPVRDKEDARVRARAREPASVMVLHCRPARSAPAPLPATEPCSAH